MKIVNRLDKADRTSLAVLGVVLAIVLFFCINLVSSLRLGAQRLDLTEDRLFTVTDSTRQVLAGLAEPMTLRLYRSQALLDQVPSLNIYADRVEQVIDTYQELSGGRISVEWIETLPFSAEEDRALGYRLEGFQLGPTGERGYFGLVGTNSVDDLETIEFLAPNREALLEYDLTRLVHRLANPDDPKVAVIDDLGIFGSLELGRYPWAVLDMISASFDVERINVADAAIPDDTDVLVIIHPHSLTPQMRYAIDQYVLGGGAALVFLDPLAENSPPNPQMQNQPLFPASELDPLLAAWGVEMVPEKVVGDRTMALRVTGAAGPNRIVADYVPWLQVRADAFNPDDVATSLLQLMRMSSVGSLKPVAGATTTLTPLIMSSPQSMLYDELDVRARPNPNELLEKFVATGERQVMAARITGPAATAYPDGPPPAEEEEAPAPGEPPAAEPAAPKPHVAQSSGPINVVVVADVDLLHDTHTVNDAGRPISNNSDFVINLLDSLVGGDALIGLRGRGVSIRPFTTIEALERQAEETYFATEQRLTQELEETQQRLAELTMPAQPGGEPVDLRSLTDEQQRTVAEFNRQLLDLRRQLRDVRAALRQDIDTLQDRSRLVNILAMPALVVLVGVGAALWRRDRLARHLRRYQKARKAKS